MLAPVLIVETAPQSEARLDRLLALFEKQFGVEDPTTGGVRLPDIEPNERVRRRGAIPKIFISDSHADTLAVNCIAGV